MTKKLIQNLLLGLMLFFVLAFISQSTVIQLAYAAEIDSEIVTNVQNALNDAGYDCGAADGIVGSSTQAAIQKYQEDKGLPVSGSIDDEFLLSLGLSAGITMNGVSGETEFETSTSKLVLTGYEIGLDYNDEETLILYFDYTNSDSSGSMAMTDFYFQVYQNGISRDSAFPEYQASWQELYNNAVKDIKDGASLDVAFAYNLENTSDPVEIEVNEFANFSDSWAFTIDLAERFNGVSEPISEDETEFIEEPEVQTEEEQTVYAPDTILTGTIIEATMNTIMLQTEDGSTYQCDTENTNFELENGGITLGIEVKVTLKSDVSDEYGLFIAERVTDDLNETESEIVIESEEEKTVYAPDTVLTGTIVEATMNSITLQIEDGSTYQCETEDTDFELISGGITLGMEVEVVLEDAVSDEYGLFKADVITEIESDEELITDLEDNQELEEPEEVPIENDNSERYIKLINNYIGKNVASIGYLSLGGEIRDKYDSSSIVLTLISEDGIYLDPQNEEQLQQYVVTDQMPAAGTEMHVTYEKDSEGNEYDNLIDDMSYDEIVLTVKPITDPGFDYQADCSLTEINPSPDKYTKYIPDYVGRNLASCGYISLAGDLRAESGHGNYKLNIITEDGSYIDPEDRETQMQYIVTSQYPEPNTENVLVFSTDSEGQEYTNLVQSATVDNVDLYVSKLPQEIIDAQPALISVDE